MPPTLIPITEETPSNIVVDYQLMSLRLGEASTKHTERLDSKKLLLPRFSGDLLLVTREVAEAAAIRHECHDGSLECDWATQPGGACSRKGKPHPLADRMVWAASRGYDDAAIVTRTAEGSRVITGYRELRRVPWVAR